MRDMSSTPSGVAIARRIAPNFCSSIWSNPACIEAKSVFSAAFSAASVSSPWANVRSSLFMAACPYADTMCSTTSDPS